MTSKSPIKSSVRSRRAGNVDTEMEDFMNEKVYIYTYYEGNRYVGKI